MKDVSLIIYAAEDLDKAKRFFRALVGADPYVDSPQYTGFKSGNTEIGLIGSGESNGLAYWDVDDIHATIKTLEDAGGSVTTQPRDVGYGLLVAAVKEPNGSTIGLRQLAKIQP